MQTPSTEKKGSQAFFRGGNIWWKMAEFGRPGRQDTVGQWSAIQERQELLSRAGQGLAEKEQTFVKSEGCAAGREPREAGSCY